MKRLIEWTFEIPLATNYFLIKDIAVALGIAAVVLIIILTAVTSAWADAETLITIAFMVIIVIGVVFFAFIVAMLLLKNRITTNFYIDNNGVGYQVADKKIKGAMTAITISGALGRSPQTTGAGILGYEEQEGFVEWPDISRVKYHDNKNVIDLTSSTNIKPIRLYCHSDNYPKIKEIIKKSATNAKF